MSSVSWRCVFPELLCDLVEEDVARIHAFADGMLNS